MLGFGDANGLLPATLVVSNRQWTTYFRRAFVVPDVTKAESLTARLLRDDAAVLYLNGIEVWRDTNMPSSAIVNSTPALTGLAGAAESEWLTNPLNPSLLVAGANLMAVEVHQNSLTSSDLAFDLELISGTSVPLNPRLTLTANRLAWPAEASWYALFTTTNLTPPIAWARIAAAPVLTNGQWTLVLPAPTNATRFFRLQWP